MFMLGRDKDSGEIWTKLREGPGRSVQIGVNTEREMEGLPNVRASPAIIRRGRLTFSVKKILRTVSR